MRPFKWGCEVLELERAVLRRLRSRPGAAAAEVGPDGLLVDEGGVRQEVSGGRGWRSGVGGRAGRGRQQQARTARVAWGHRSEWTGRLTRTSPGSRAHVAAGRGRGGPSGVRTVEGEDRLGGCGEDRAGWEREPGRLLLPRQAAHPPEPRTVQQ